MQAAAQAAAEAAAIAAAIAAAEAQAELDGSMEGDSSSDWQMDYSFKEAKMATLYGYQEYVFSIYDEDGSGDLFFDEALTAIVDLLDNNGMQKLVNRLVDDNELANEVFAAWDQDNDGFLNKGDWVDSVVQIAGW